MATVLNKRCACTMLLCLLASALATTPALGAERTTKKPTVKKISLLYALGAGSGTLTPQKGRGAKYELTLKGLDRNVTWFSDRPARHSGAFPVSDLAGSWKGLGFAGDPPNAALTYTDGSGRPGRTVIVELSHPSFANSRLSFAARVLNPGSLHAPNLAGHAAAADREPDHRFTDASLFIDDTSALELKGCAFIVIARCIGLDLSRSNLSNMDLESSIFASSNLDESIISQVDLTFAVLTDTSFENAHLNFVQLDGARMQGANFAGAELSHVSFEYSDLEGADLTGAKVGEEVSFYGANLCNARMPNGTIGACGGGLLP